MPYPKPRHCTQCGLLLFRSADHAHNQTPPLRWEPAAHLDNGALVALCPGCGGLDKLSATARETVVGQIVARLGGEPPEAIIRVDLGVDEIEKTYKVYLACRSIEETARQVNRSAYTLRRRWLAAGYEYPVVHAR